MKDRTRNARRRAAEPQGRIVYGVSLVGELYRVWWFQQQIEEGLARLRRCEAIREEFKTPPRETLVFDRVPDSAMSDVKAAMDYFDRVMRLAILGGE